MSVEDRVAIVTGATGGMGQHLVRALCEEGAAVVIHYLHREQEANALVKEMDACGHRVLAVQANVANEADVARLVNETIGEFDRVDILINNAGISRDGISWKMDSIAWQEVLDTNLTGAFYTTKAVLPFMRETQWGRIINISSVVAQTGVPGTAAYAASKAGLMGLTRAVASEVASRNISVNCLALGYFDVGLIEQLSEQMKDEILSRIPAGHLGAPGTVSEAVLYLCSEAARFVTGQVINLNGGLFMG